MNKELLPIRILFCFLFLHLTHSQLHINLYLTEWVSNDEKNKDLQHDCLDVVTTVEESITRGYIISYCLGEWPSKWNIQENNFDRQYTFAELSKRNITSEQLYFWSAPMDIVENYQFYLNQLPNSAKTSMAKQVFYNCTLPNFGPKCQYTLNNYKPHHSSLNEIIYDFYCWNVYEPSILTCYTHLQCNHGPFPSCLDWTEICDGKIDCLDGGQDEQHCWELEINECNENEYRCDNGQCIPQIFFNDGDIFFDCLDQSDEPRLRNIPTIPNINSCSVPGPTFLSEDTACIRFADMFWNTLTSSCNLNRQLLLLQALFSVKPKSLSDECWTALKCVIYVHFPVDTLCVTLCSDGICDELIRITCPNFIYASAVPILLSHVYLVYENKNLKYGSSDITKSMYVCYNDQLLYLPGSNENKTRSLSDNYICRPYTSFVFYLDMFESTRIDQFIVDLNSRLQILTSWLYNNSLICNKSIAYQCMNSSKCISKHRLYDSFQDCFYYNDEDISLWDKKLFNQAEYKSLQM